MASNASNVFTSLMMFAFVPLEIYSMFNLMAINLL